MNLNKIKGLKLINTKKFIRATTLIKKFDITMPHVKKLKLKIQ